MTGPWDRCSPDNWRTERRAVPEELEETYTAAQWAAAAAIGFLDAEQQDELFNAIHLFECDHCGRTYDSEASIRWCCNSDEDRRRGIYRGSD